ncbi:hypothetical protein CR513_59741, partial [Mucuna pruriens]
MLLLLTITCMPKFVDALILLDDHKSTPRYIFMLLRNFISEFHLVESISNFVTIYYDNSVAICFSQNKKVQEFQTYIEHIPTKLMVEDPLTKGPVKIFVNHVAHMGI